MNRLDQVIHDDCLTVLSPWTGPAFDLAYLDPPFNTGKVQALGDHAYGDQWDSMSGYLAFMRPRIEQTLRALEDDGIILLHCDWRTSHHFRLMLDELIGPERFVNHLIWSYGLGGSSPRRFARKHDDILFYAKSDRYFFDPPRVPATSNRMRGRTKKATDVLEIPSINNMAAERTGYPTQKPLALLQMLIGACCRPGGSVIDPFCGSGTTLVAAAQSDRRFLGIDRNEEAVRIACERLSPCRAPV